MTYHTWTPDEVALLASIYPDTSTSDVPVGTITTHRIVG